MAEKILNTRIQLKGDSYANWIEKNPVLLANEIAIVSITEEDSTSVNKPGVYFKVGDGTSNFSELGFTSGIAGDVYQWAKAANKPVYTATEITGLEDYISGKINDTNTKYQIIQDLNNQNKFTLQSKEIGETEWTNVSIITIPTVETPEVTVPEYTLVKLTTPTNGAFATYELQKDGVLVGEKIDIPKDYLVKSATIKTAEGESDPSGYPAGTKYIDFVVNSIEGVGNESHIYLNVNELVDAYTSGNGISISDTNEISIKIVSENGLSVDASGIKMALATTDTAGAMSASDKTKLDNLHTIATSGNVNDLVQTEGDVLVLNCGNATL